MNLSSICSILAAGIFVSTLGGCAGTDTESGEQLASTTQVCSTEAPLGSSIAKRTCHSPMTQQQRDALDREITLHAQPASLLKK